MTRSHLLAAVSHLCLVASVAALDPVEILISSTDQAYLEADPYDADKVPASWISGPDTIAASVSYRGAYSLRNLMLAPDGRRNWKLKTPKTSPYRGYREWNYNLEPHLRQKLSLDLYAAAGVAATPSRHVTLSVNGARSGTYLEFPDPDNKDWLAKTWGSAAGDLYKAATDLPDHPAFFGELTDLGDSDSAYYRHYQKKTNNDGVDSLDYSNLREFVVWLNRSTDAEFEQGLLARFDLYAFLRYLVVSNYVGHWDGYPNRGKNFWLYRTPSDGIWHLFPWDVDASFQSTLFCLDNMGVSAGLFFMAWPANYCGNVLETRMRPLFERVMAVPAWREMYLGEYQKALGTYLEKTALLKRVDSLEALVKPGLASWETSDFNKSQTDIRNFISKRNAFLGAELAKYPSYDPPPVPVYDKIRLARPSKGPWLDFRGRPLSVDLSKAPPGVYSRDGLRRVVF